MDRSLAGLRACPLRQRDRAPQCGLKPAELVKNLGHAPKDGPHDAGEFGTDATASLAWAGCYRPVLKDGLDLIELLVRAVDCDDLDGAVALSRRQLGVSARVLSAVRVSWPGSA